MWIGPFSFSSPGWFECSTLSNPLLTSRGNWAPITYGYRAHPICWGDAPMCTLSCIPYVLNNKKCYPWKWESGGTKKIAKISVYAMQFCQIVLCNLCFLMLWKSADCVWGGYICPPTQAICPLSLGIRPSYVPIQITLCAPQYSR